MKPFSDDAQIRELVQSLKYVDEQQAPSFDYTLTKSPPQLSRSLRRVQSAWACCAATVCLSAYLFLRSQPDNSAVGIVPGIETSGDTPAPIVASNLPHSSSDRTADSDFDRSRRSVDDYFRETQSQHRASLCVWSSCTDSLLVLTLNQPLLQE